MRSLGWLAEGPRFDTPLLRLTFLSLKIKKIKIIMDSALPFIINETLKGLHRCPSECGGDPVRLAGLYAFTKQAGNQSGGDSVR